MKAPNFLHELVSRFVPMDEVEKMNLKNDTSTEYVKILAEIQNIEMENQLAASDNQTNKDNPDWKVLEMKPLKMKHRIVKAFESVLGRYIFAILFVALIPVIRNIINGEPKEDEPEDEQSDLGLFMEFQRMKKSQR